MATAIRPVVPTAPNLLDEFREWVTRNGPRVLPSSAKRYRGYAAEFCALASPLRATSKDLQRWRISVETGNGRPLAPSTVNVKIAAVKAFFSFLCDRGYRDTDPSATLELATVPKGLPNPLTKEQVQAVFDHAYTVETTPMVLQERAMLEVFYGSGLRREELGNLTLDCIVDHGTLQVIGKGEKTRRTIITPPEYRAVRAWINHYLADEQAKSKGAQVRAVLPDSIAAEQREEVVAEAIFSDFRARNPTAPIFYTSTGTPLRDHKDPGQFAYRRTCPYLRVVVPDDCNPHRLRHTFATDLLEGGVDILTLKELLGHSDIRTTMVYTQVRPSLYNKARLAHPRT